MVIKCIPAREDHSTPVNAASCGKVMHRRSFLTSAGKASFGLAATSGLAGSFAKSVLAKDKVTTMGFDHPYNFVTYVSDIQRWGTVYAEAHGLKALYTSDNGKLDAQIANLETWIAQGVPAICCFPIEPTAIERVAAKARSKGIVWVSYAAHLKNQDSSVVFGNTREWSAFGDCCSELYQQGSRRQSRDYSTNIAGRR